MAIQFHEVSKRLGRNQVLRDLQLDVARGESLVIIGRSGTGKSVLLKHVVGLMRPDQGTVRVNGVDVASLEEKELLSLREQMGMLFQGGALFDSMTIGENVGLALREHTPLPEPQIEIIVSEKLALVGLSGSEGSRPSSLSGGMKKRAALARALALNPKIMLYDEPTTGLDPVMADVINNLILQYGKSSRVTSVVVTHDMTSAFKVGTRFLMLHKGRILFDGDAAALRACNDPYIAGFIAGDARALDLMQ